MRLHFHSTDICSTSAFLCRHACIATTLKFSRMNPNFPSSVEPTVFTMLWVCCDTFGLHLRIKPKSYKNFPRSPHKSWGCGTCGTCGTFGTFGSSSEWHSTQNMWEALGSHVGLTFNCNFLITKAPALTHCMCFIADGLITITPARVIRRFFIPPYHRNRTADFYNRTRWWQT